jgi:predicted Zn-dependent peptidase
VRELDAIGSQYNAFTSQEYTGYYAKSNPKHIDKILDVVSELYLNPTLPEAEVEKEKGVIVDEIGMYEDLPMQEVHEVFGHLLYGDQPAGWKVTGTKDSVRGITREDLFQYRKKHYVASATTIVVSGNFDEEKILMDIEEKFARISEDKKEEKLKVTEVQAKPQMKIDDKKTDQTHIVIGVRTFDIFSKKNIALKVLSAVLGGGMSSRLFLKLRDEMGIGYYVQASADSLTDHGYFTVSIGTDHTKVKKAVETIVSELVKMKKELVSEAELTKVKDYIIGNMYLSLETSDSLAEFYGLREVLKKELITPDEIATEIKKITREDVQKIAEEIFTDERLNLAIVGRVDDANTLSTLLRLS